LEEREDEAGLNGDWCRRRFRSHASSDRARWHAVIGALLRIGGSAGGGQQDRVPGGNRLLASGRSAPRIRTWPAAEADGGPPPGAW